MYTLTAGSAFLSMMLCSWLVGYLNEMGARTVTKGLLDDFLATRVFGPDGLMREGYFEPMLHERGREDLDSENRAILYAIAKHSTEAQYVPINSIDCDGLTRDRIAELIERLVDRNVLVRSKGGCSIKVKLFERWLRETMGD